MLALTLLLPSSPHCSRGEASRSRNSNDPNLMLLQIFTYAFRHQPAGGGPVRGQICPGLFLTNKPSSYDSVKTRTTEGLSRLGGTRQTHTCTTKTRSPRGRGSREPAKAPQQGLAPARQTPNSRREWFPGSQPACPGRLSRSPEEHRA